MMDWVWAALAAVVGFAAIWFGGRRAGISDVKEKQAEARQKAVKQAQEIENEVEALDHDELKRRARRWLRGTKR